MEVRCHLGVCCIHFVFLFLFAFLNSESGTGHHMAWHAQSGCFGSILCFVSIASWFLWRSKLDWTGLNGPMAAIFIMK